MTGRRGDLVCRRQLSRACTPGLMEAHGDRERGDLVYRRQLSRACTPGLMEAHSDREEG